MMTPDAGLAVLLSKTFLIWVRSLLKKRLKNKQNVVDVGAFFNITWKLIRKISHETRQKKEVSGASSNIIAGNLPGIAESNVKKNNNLNCYEIGAEIKNKIEGLH